jgi:D-3-phosphoglycerate dehydrogenase
MFKVGVFDNISASGLSGFDKKKYTFGKQIKDPDAILVRSSRLHDYFFSDSLLAIARAGVGTDNIPVDILTAKGIPVFFAPGANANAVKELVLAAMLIGFRSINTAIDFVNQLEISDKKLLHQEIEAQKKRFVGREIICKTLGVIGLGNVGVKIADAAHSLGMNVLAYDPQININNALALSPMVHKTDYLEMIFTKADIITIHVPLNQNTKCLINAKHLVMTKPSLLLLNFSREEIVEEASILAHLHQHKESIYITDFAVPAFRNHPQVICFPHLGASTYEAQENSSVMVIRSICNYLESGTIQNSVNFPDIQLASPLNYKGQRLVIINKNKPGLIAKISTVLSESGINIEGMVNASKEDIAINLVDYSEHVHNQEELIEKLMILDDVIKVRRIDF